MWSSDEEQQMSVEELILVEQSLTTEERRARYRCKDKFVTPDKLDELLWNRLAPSLPKSDQPVLPDIVANEKINSKVVLMRGDICTLEVDAVVNAANERLLGGGGIDGAIHSAAGRNLYRECKTLGGAKTGTTKLTRGYNLPARYVLHTVGPIGTGEELLAMCYRSLLEIVQNKEDIRTVALCGVSTGIFGFDLRVATNIALREVRTWMEAHSDTVDKVIFCTFLPRELEMYQELMPQYFPL